jgi:polysaccharide export outer membrane protein
MLIGRMCYKISPCLILALFLVLTSCSKRQYQYLFQQKTAVTDTSANQNIAAVSVYRIKPQDILEIKNLQNSKDIVDLNPAVNGAPTGLANTQTQAPGYLVEDDGTVALTGLGRVPVAGLTRTEAQRLIEDMYRKTVLKDPIISIRITNLSVSLFGEVHTPGNYPLTRDKTTLVQVLGLAGGLNDQANETNVKIIRGSQKDPKIILVDLGNVRSINDPRAILENGDIVYVEKNRRAVRNDNFLNLSQIVQPALLLFNTALIILTFTRR